MDDILDWLMCSTRELVYNAGFRPKPGTVFYSPARVYAIFGKEAMAAGVKTVNEARIRMLIDEVRRLQTMYPNDIMTLSQVRNSMGMRSINNPCVACGKTDDKKPICFKGESWCCEICRKYIMGELED